MTNRFSDYLREAFNAKPWGMFVAPNWIALAGFGIGGFLNPGFWLLGTGLELAYLWLLTSNPRFRKIVDLQQSDQAGLEWDARLSQRTAKLSPEDLARFRALESRCQSLLVQPKDGDAPDLHLQAEGLGRLLWIYLGLLGTRQTLQQFDASKPTGTTEKLHRLEAQMEKERDENVRKSLSGQIDILRQRAATQEEGRSKLAFLEAELGRIEEQVELIREQSLLAADPASVSRHIDEVGSSLGGTTQWIREQQKLYGEMKDVLEDPPAMPLQQQ